MSLEKLPYEVVDNILRRIDRRYYYLHLFVSKKWHALAKPIYYRQVNIYSHKFEWILQQLFLKENSTISFETLSSATTTLVISDGRYKPKNNSVPYVTEEAILLLSRFKNLKVLEVKHRCVYEDLFLAAINACDARHFPNMEQIIVGYNIPSLPIYSKFHQTLKRIVFDCSGPAPNGDLGKDLLKVLPDLKNLRELTVVNNAGRNATLLSLLEASPNLSTINYTTTFSLSSDNGYLSLRNISESHQACATIPFKNLKTMRLNIPTLTKPYIDFFMEYFHPENLDQLTIVVKNQSFFDLIRTQTLAVILGFATRLSKVKTFHIEFDECVDVEDIRPGPLSKLDMFYEVLSAIQGNRKWTRCTAHFETCWAFELSISITDDSELTYHYFLNAEDYELDYYGDIHWNSPRSYDVFTVPTPDKSWIAGPEIINDLHFRAKHEDINKEFEVYLDYAINNCPQLASLQLFSNDKAISALLAKNLDSKKRSSLKDMEFVMLKQVKHSQYLLDRFVPYFPNVKFFKYSAIIKDDAMFDLTRFEKLEAFAIDVEDIVRAYGSANVFFDIEIVGRNIGCFEVLEERRNGKCICNLSPRPVGKIYDSSVQKYALYIKCLPQLKKLKISNYTPFFDLAKYSREHLKPNLVTAGYKMDVPIDLT